VLIEWLEGTTARALEPQIEFVDQGDGKAVAILGQHQLESVRWRRVANERLNDP
jgi:hypothetical protein